MRALIDLCHPADVHFFRVVAQLLNSKGHEVIYTARDKDVVLPLCNEFRMDYHLIGGHHVSLSGKLWELIHRSGKLSKFMAKNKVDAIVGFGNPYTVVAGHLCQKPSLFITDTENAGFTNNIGFGSATVTLTPTWFGTLPGTRHKQEPWFKELAYIERMTKSGGKPRSKYIIIRKVAWTASHDQTHHGLDDMQMFQDKLGRFKIYIIHERRNKSEKDAVHNVRLLHKLIAGAALVISEGATTAAEAALLGKRTIYVNTQKPGYIRKLVETGALHLASDSLSAASMAEQLLNQETTELSELKTLKKKCIDIAEETTKLITGLCK